MTLRETVRPLHDAGGSVKGSVLRGREREDFDTRSGTLALTDR
jgi:hypothetical protein